MTVTKALLNKIIKMYGIRKGKPTEQARKRLAIILAEMFIDEGLSARSGAILERCFYDYLQGIELDCNETDYERHLSTIKQAYQVDALKIGIPEGLEYSGDVIYKVTQVIQYLKEASNGKGTKKNHPGGNTVRGLEYQKGHIGYIKAEGLKVYQGNKPKQILL